ncbi:hypothetical protein EDB86DRAFT_3249056 [Lactarius hatsudake]|nr:hypothetical protein EDB86DRAFT_3249056 [Lactarius hatsudake]
MLRGLKHLSMNAVLLEVLQSVTAIETLTRILDEQSLGPHSTTCYNLCRLNKGRQEEVAQAGIIPIIELHQETARVEDELAKPKSLDAFLKCFVSAKAGSFENLLDPFLKICRHSTAIAIGIAKGAVLPARHGEAEQQQGGGGAEPALHPPRRLRRPPEPRVARERFGIHETIASLRRKDGAVLVREIGPSLTPALKPSLRGADMPKSSIASKRCTTRPTASDTSRIGTPSPPLGTGLMNNPRVTSEGAGLALGRRVGFRCACMLAISRGSLRLASARDGAERQHRTHKRAAVGAGCIVL